MSSPLKAGSTLNEVVLTSDHTWLITSGILSYRTNTEPAAGENA